MFIDNSVDMIGMISFCFYILSGVFFFVSAYMDPGYVIQKFNILVRILDINFIYFKIGTHLASK
jgi:hypothetical protein